jgi:hypothetical protein
MIINPSQFGRDHWTLLAYIESMCVNGAQGVGTLGRTKMRCEPEAHSIHKNAMQWKPSYSTRLKGYAAKHAPDNQSMGHDDWHCLDDFEAADYVQVVSHIMGTVTLKPEGIRVSALLRAHKANGGQFGQFELPITKGS